MIVEFRDPANVIAAIAGGSGVVGSRAVRHLLARDEVRRVMAVGRRVLPIEHPKLVSAAVDLQHADGIVGALGEHVDLALCCLGTTMKRAGSSAAFRAVDYDAIVNFAAAALARGAERFVLVSAIGAYARAGNFYLRVKGEAEEAVARLGFQNLTVLRPSFIDDQGTRSEYRRGERLALPVARLVFSAIGKTSRYAPISADVLGKAVVQLAFDRTSERVRIVEGRDLHAAGR